jgi:hypothetical protein
VRPAGEGRVLAVDDAGDVLLVDAATERGRRIHVGDGDGFVGDADARGDAIALLVADDAGRTEVRLYRVR